MDDKQRTEKLYPEALLPKGGDEGYIAEINLSGIYLRQNFFTQRRACCPKVECAKMGEVTFKAIYNEGAPDDKRGGDLIGFSVNMMGTPHLPEYGKWHQTNPGSKPWDGNEVDIKKYEGCYDLDENQAFVYLDAGSLEGDPFPFERRMERIVFDRYKNVPEVYKRAFSNAAAYPIKGCIRHFHAPSFLNYWHAEIWIIDEYLQEKVKYIKGGKEWKVKIQRQLVERLRAHAVTELPPVYDRIAPSVYMKT